MTETAYESLPFTKLPVVGERGENLIRNDPDKRKLSSSLCLTTCLQLQETQRHEIKKNPLFKPSLTLISIFQKKKKCPTNYAYDSALWGDLEPLGSSPREQKKRTWNNISP